MVLIDDKLVGSGGINSEWEDRASVIAWDMIHPGIRGKGIGMQLLQHRISLLKQLDPVPLIRVRTSQHTFGFYEKEDLFCKRSFLTTGHRVLISMI